MRENEIDFISQPRLLVDAIPKFEDLFDGIQDLKTRHEETRKISNARKAIGMSDGGTLMRVCCMPHELLCAIWEVNPGFLKDKPEFYRWLQRHPEYRVGMSLAY